MLLQRTNCSVDSSTTAIRSVPPAGLKRAYEFGLCARRWLREVSKYNPVNKIALDRTLYAGNASSRITMGNCKDVSQE